MHAQIITLKAVRDALNQSVIAVSPLGGELLQHLMPHLVAEYGPQFVRDLWSNEQLTFEQFVPADAGVAEFVERRQLQWVVEPKTAAPPTLAALQPAPAKVQQRIKELLLAETRSDAIFDYITVRADNNKKQPETEYTNWRKSVAEHLFEICTTTTTA